MKLSRFTIAAAGVVMLFAAAASAFSLSTGSSGVVITPCTEGSAFVSVSGAPPGSQVYFSASSASAGLRFDSPSPQADWAGGAGSSLHVSAPGCFEGTSQVLVTARVCPGQCTEKTTYLTVVSRPCPGMACKQASVSTQTSQGYVPAVSCGSAGCREVRSSVTNYPYFGPSATSATISKITPTTCVEPGRRCDVQQLKAGDAVIMQYRVANTGAAATFTLESDPSPGIEVSPPSQEVSLNRLESNVVTLVTRVSPDVKPTITSVTLRLLDGARVVEEKNQFFEIPAVTGAKLSLAGITSAGVDVDACGAAAGSTYPIRAVIENKGNMADTYTIMASVGSEVISTTAVTVPENGLEEIVVSVPVSSLKAGENAVMINAFSGSFQGAGITVLRVAQCTTSAGVAAPATSQAERTIAVTVEVSNNGNSAIGGVTGVVTGVPSTWTQSSNPVSIPAHGKANVTVLVTANSDEQATPVLVVKAGDEVLATKQLASVNTSSGVTGFFTLGTTWMFVEFLIIAMLLLGLYFYAKDYRSAPRKTPSQRRKEEYVAKLHRIRDAVSPDGSDGDSATLSN